jgi:hypothetical protein
MARHRVPATRIATDHPDQTARAIRSRYGLNTETVANRAVAKLVRSSSTVAVINTDRVQDVEAFLRRQGRLKDRQPSAAETIARLAGAR